MGTGQKNEKQTVTEDTQTDSMWRRPIILDSFEDEDPLATLYQGREAGTKSKNTEDSPQITTKDAAKSNAENTKTLVKSASKTKSKKSAVKKIIETSEANDEKSKDAPLTKLSEEELKNLLKIKSDTFQFTDIREILRGKSFDIYAYLLFLSGDTGVCKIKHLDLMKILDISRPTLFKQGDWLTRLSLIEKSNVPGDHLGTSYTVYRLENVLPVSQTLVEQIQFQVKSFGQEGE